MGSLPVRRHVSHLHLPVVWPSTRMDPIRVYRSIGILPTYQIILLQTKSVALLSLWYVSRVVLDGIVLIAYLSFLLGSNRVSWHEDNQDSTADCPAYATLSISSTCFGSGCFPLPPVSSSVATFSLWVSSAYSARGSWLTFRTIGERDYNMAKFARLSFARQGHQSLHPHVRASNCILVSELMNRYPPIVLTVILSARLVSSRW